LQTHPHFANPVFKFCRIGTLPQRGHYRLHAFMDKPFCLGNIVVDFGYRSGAG
jgi:hypothetical protein